jgi:hypothetical protein
VDSQSVSTIVCFFVWVFKPVAAQPKAKLLGGFSFVH